LHYITSRFHLPRSGYGKYCHIYVLLHDVMEGAAEIMNLFESEITVLK